MRERNSPVFKTAALLSGRALTDYQDIKPVFVIVSGSVLIPNAVNDKMRQNRREKRPRLVLRGRGGGG